MVYRLVRQFRKEYKYSLGAELQSIMWQIVDEIIRTNSLADMDKKAAIKGISMLFDRFKIRFRFSYELGLVSAQKFSTTQASLEEIGKMIGGWSKWSQSKG